MSAADPPTAVGRPRPASDPGTGSDSATTRDFCDATGAGSRSDQPGATTPSSVLGEGCRIGPYRTERLLGRGGMGEVYLAVREDDFEKRVAVKLIRAGLDREEIVRRFVWERQILAQLEHPGIAHLKDGGTTADGHPYLVMEYVEGEPIDAWCAARAPSLPERLELFCKVLEAVGFAHQNLVVHRDLKPANILIDAAGQPKLLDFGIAKLLDAESALGITRDRVPMTLRYASPEQILGQPITTASDIYSLGLTFYLLLTGHLPEDAESSAPHLRALRQDVPPKPSAILRARPSADGRGQRRWSRRLIGDLDAIALKALRREPPLRYRSAEAFADDVRRHLDGRPVLARKGSFLYLAERFVRRNAVALGAAVVLFAATVGLGVAMSKQARERERVESVVRLLEELFHLPNPWLQLDPRDLLDRGTATIGTALADEPDLQARLLAALGRSYGSLGSPELGRELLEESLLIRTAAHGWDHPLVAESLHNLGVVHRQLGDVDEAEKLMRQAIAIQRRIGAGGDPLDFPRGLTNLAALLEDQGALDEAEALFRESLRRKRAILGPEHPEVAVSLSSLGTLHEARGELDRAEALFEESLLIRRRTLEPDDPSLVLSLGHLARVAYKRGEYERAVPLFREVVEKRREIFGSRHPAVARGLNNLAVGLHRLGRLDEAEPNHRRALELRRRELGAEHPDVAVSERNLAALLLDRGDPVSAEALIRSALDIQLGIRGSEHWRVADARSVLGACLASQGRLDEAEPILAESYARLLEARGEAALYTRDARRRLAELEGARREAAGAPSPGTGENL